MCPKRSLWYKLIALALALVLVVPILMACGDSNSSEEKTPAPTPTPTATLGPTATPTATIMPTATPTSSLAPVKIGIISEWSGPLGVAGVLIDQLTALVQTQIKNQGGLLGGREIKFIRADDAGVLAQSVAQAKKLVLEDKVSVLTMGGISVASFTAVAQAAEELKVPYIPPATIFGIKDLKYSVCPTTHDAFITPLDSFVGDVLKPKTVAWLGYDGEDSHGILDGGDGAVGLRDRLKARGIDIVYEQNVPMDAVDFSPYLTKIQYLKPDVFIGFLNSIGQSITVNKQIAELGGWGNIKYFAGAPPSASMSAVKIPSAVGTYVLATWLPGSDDPGMKAFEDAFMQKYGREPTPEMSALYNPLWIAIKGIELAGSDDPEKVAQTLRSGNFECDTAWGPLRISTDGTGDITLTIAQVQAGGKLVKVWP